MIGDDVLRVIKPEGRHLRQDRSFTGNPVLQNMVKGRDAVRGSHDQAVSDIIYLSDLA